MSELIQANTNRTAIRGQFLATASAAVLVAYVASASVACASDDGRPTVWIELGGQMEGIGGETSPNVAPFMSIPAGPYDPETLVTNQRPPRHAFGLEGKLSFQPEGSDWIFSVGVLYGRSNLNRHVHDQGPDVTNSRFNNFDKYAAAFDDVKTVQEESHSVLDFSAGKDVGLGRFGNEGASQISLGVRYAQFSYKSTLSETARPTVNVVFPYGLRGYPSFHQYTMVANAERSFRGIGPSLSWNASATILGNRDRAEVTFDWGVNGAVLFGRQKAKTSHRTDAYYLPPSYYAYLYYHKSHLANNHNTRSRSVIVPNVGAFAGLSLKKGIAKISLGYRADFFFGAVDTGIDERQTKTLGFYGPFATISIGLGG